MSLSDKPFLSTRPEREKMRDWLIETIPKTFDQARASRMVEYLGWVEEDIKQLKLMEEEGMFDVVEEECPIDSDTCEMDTTKTLSEDKNKELMQHGLDGLSDLL